MSGTDLEQKNERKALVGLAQSIRKLKAAPRPTARFITKKAAARRLRISQRELRLRIATGELDTERIGRRVLIFL